MAFTYPAGQSMNALLADKAFYKAGGSLVEAKRSGGSTISVITKFSSNKIDDQNDSFSKAAWDHKEDVDHFMRKGFADWNHLYPINKKLAMEALKKGDAQACNKAEELALKSIVGQPEKLWSEQDGPYCKIRLYANNEFIKAYEPALMANSDRFGVSAAGVVLDSQKDGGIKIVKRARLSQISICPLLEAINDDTTINLVKSQAAEFLLGKEEESPIQKACGYVGRDSSPNETKPASSTEKIKLLDFILRYLCTQKSFAGFVKEESKRIYGENHSHTELKSYLQDCFSLSEDDAGELAALAMMEMNKK